MTQQQCQQCNNNADNATTMPTMQQQHQQRNNNTDNATTTPTTQQQHQQHNNDDTTMMMMRQQ